MRINSRDAVMVRAASSTNVHQHPLRTDSMFNAVQRASIGSAMLRPSTAAPVNQQQPPRIHQNEWKATDLGIAQPQAQSLRRTQSALR